MKDWNGNSKTTFTTLGASSHSKHQREKHDYYATDPKCVDDLLNILPELNNIWECACGEGHLSERLIKNGKEVFSSDLIDRGYGDMDLDFLELDNPHDGDIITNPPYKYAQEFVEKSLKIIPEGRYSCMFLKLTFLEGQKRKDLFKKFPPKYVCVYSQRQKCAMNGDFKNTGSSAVCYAWFIWEKGCYDETKIKWI